MTGEWRVAGFSELRELGAGAQGRVALARHQESGTPVAVKYMLTRAGEKERERLRHEARMLARAASPHVARLYRLVESEHGAALVMEAVDGVSLKVVLEHHGRLGPEAALTVLKGALLGLAAAHDLGVVHRDFKPANVVVPKDGRSKLVDFGIAVPVGEAGSAGTPLYMAPEQWERRTATPATDVYAATCVFVECVTGARPYGGTLAEIRAAHLAAPVPVTGLDEPLRPLVESGMAKRSADRPESAAAFVERLDMVARAAYGDDWERRGVQALAAAAAALAALFPLAAILAPGGAAVAGSTAFTAPAATAGTGSLVPGAGVAATVAVGAALLVVPGALLVDRATDPPVAPSPTAARSRPATNTVPVACPIARRGITGPPASVPPRAVVHPLVRWPSDARLVGVDRDSLVVAPRGGTCTAHVAVSAAPAFTVRRGEEWVHARQVGSTPGRAEFACDYFPDSPDAAAARRTYASSPSMCDPGRATAPRIDVATAATGWRIAVSTAVELDGRPGPYPWKVIALMPPAGFPAGVSDVPARLLGCRTPPERQDLCRAAFVDIYVRHVADDVDAAALERTVRRIEGALVRIRPGD